MGKFVLVLVLGLLVGFASGLLPIVLPAVSEAGDATPREISLGPTSTKASSETAAPSDSGVSAPQPTGVDPDCYADAFTCKKERIYDAVHVADAIRLVVGQAGWSWGCFTVQYIGGDDGEKDAISVALEGSPPAYLPHCTEGKLGRDVTKPELSKLAAKIKKALAGTKLTQNVDMLQVVGGRDIEIQMRIK